MNNTFACIDCEHCLPDSDGPTSMGICLLDPEFEHYIEEIMELDFKRCPLVGLYWLHFDIPVDREKERLYVLMTHNIKEPTYASTFH
ncbi:MAG: hypothetical protein D5R98_04760 [Desulfonatronovibrio sp. MSAO_Bac4]|nr:MAG: hypothetical protein D5R98_04760 [Desulfonatronovibrio sp. MSAO_Bac4]